MDVAMSATANRYTEGSMDERKYLTAEEVSERYRGSVSVGTLRNWRAMKVGPTFVKIGKAVLYPIDELEAWDQKNMVTCRASKRLTTDPSDEA
jgi:Helix-turn-helix domain